MLPLLGALYEPSPQLAVLLANDFRALDLNLANT